MRKIHLILLISAAVMCLSSAYSLAAINQVYEVDFEWYSQYHDTFVNEKRDTSRYRWYLQEYPEQMRFIIAGNSLDYEALLSKYEDGKLKNLNMDFGRYIALSCDFGKVYSPEYRIKVVNIAQRGDTVEVMVSLNNPEKVKPDNHEGYEYSSFDVIRIDRGSFPNKGKLRFVIKSQDGVQLSEQYYEVL